MTNAITDVRWDHVSECPEYYLTFIAKYLLCYRNIIAAVTQELICSSWVLHIRIIPFLNVCNTNVRTTKMKLN